MKALLKEAALLGCRISGLYALKHLQQRNLYKVLCYHRFVTGKEEPVISRKYVTQDSFARQIRYLKARFEIKPIEEVISLRNREGAFPRNTISITIDDGYEDNYIYAYPVLRHFAIPATIYLVHDFIESQIWLWQDKIKYALRATQLKQVNADSELGMIDVRDYEKLIKSQLRIYDIMVSSNTSNRERLMEILFEALEVYLPPKPPNDYLPLNWSQIKEMSENGIAFGSHSCSHEVLPRLVQEDLTHETKDARLLIEKRIGLPVQTFCYPHGKISESVLEAVRSSGYSGAVGGMGANNGKADVFELGRIYQGGGSHGSFIRSLYQV